MTLFVRAALAFLMLAPVWGGLASASSQNPLVLPRLQGEIKLDGFSDEPAWQAIEPLPLISRGEYLLLIQPAAPAEILGWGKRPDSGFSNRLVRAAVRLHELGVHGSYLFYRDRGGPCGGDSGGPLLVDGLEGRPVLVGVASTTGGNLCSSGGGVAAYTNIAAVRRFIEETLVD